MLFTRARFTLIVAALLAATPCCAFGQEAPSSPSPSAPPTPAALPSPVPAPETPKLHRLAVAQFVAWQQGQIDRSQYSDQMNAELTDDVIADASKTLANLGALQSATFRGVSHAKQGDLYVYHMVCDRGAVDMDFGLDPQGRIQVIGFN